MLKVFEDWLEKNQGNWEQNNIRTVETIYSYPPDYPINLIVIRHETVHALGDIEIRARNKGTDGNLYQIDFSAIKIISEQRFYCYYEFTDDADFAILTNGNKSMFHL